MQIPLTQGRFAEVDVEDFDRVSRFKWHYKNGYAARSLGPQGKQIRIWMHCFLLGVDCGVDHIDRNGLNNHRSNLRLASKSLQGHNRLMPERDLPRGVSFHRGRYQSSIRIDHKLVYLGRFDTPEEAEAVYLRKCLEVHKELPPRWR